MVSNDWISQETLIDRIKILEKKVRELEEITARLRRLGPRPVDHSS